MDTAQMNLRLVIPEASPVSRARRDRLAAKEVGVLEEGQALPPDVTSLRRETQHLLLVAAVQGPAFSPDLAAEMLDIPPGRALAPLDEAMGAGVVQVAGDTIAFRSRELYRAVYDAIPGPIRSAMHRQCGQLLLVHDLPHEAVRQLCSGAEKGHQAGLELLDQAVQQLRARDPRAAAQAATLAVTLTPTIATDRSTRCVTAVEILIAAGKPMDAVRLAQSALRRGGRPNEWSARLHLALAVVALLRGDTQAAVLEVCATEATAEVPDDVYDQAHRTGLLCALMSGDLDAATAAAMELLSGDQMSSGSDATLAAALSVLAELAWAQGRVQDALCLARAAVRRLDRGPAAGQHPRFRLAAMHTALGDLDTARACIEEAIAELDAPTDALWSACPGIARSRYALASGRLAEAADQAESALATARELGTAPFAFEASTLLARATLRRGDLHAAGDLLARQPVSDAAARREDHASAWVSATLCEAQGGPSEALGSAHQLCATLAARPRLFLDEATAAAWLTRVACAAGDVGMAHAVVAQIERLALANPGVRSLAASCSHARALLDENAEALERAAMIQTDPWACASAWEDAGRLYAAAGDRSRARSTLGEALSRYQAGAAERDSARVRARLRRLGVRRSHGSRKARPISGWNSLTESEQRVARVIAEGLTTAQAAQRLFLSPHTVDSHVRHSFRKLAIKSRVEMTRIVLQSDTAEHRTIDV
jgi:DNA-binding CsgD family transcriptional regulator